MHRYSAHGHEVCFVDLRTWLKALLAAIGSGEAAKKAPLGIILTTLRGGASLRSWLDSLDPTVAVVMHQAIMDSPLRSSELKNVHQLLQQARQIADYLKQIVSDPQKATENGIDELKRMRAFCLALSKRALAYEQSLYESKPAHTYGMSGEKTSTRVCS